MALPFDIQKRAEDLFRDVEIPVELIPTDLSGKPFREPPVYSVTMMRTEAKEKAIQLSTEAVAAEREKYEKEIREMREAFERILYGAEPANEREYQSWVSTAKNIANEQLQQRIKQLEYGK